MEQYHKLKKYMELCGVNQKEVSSTKTYTKTLQWLGRILSGSVSIPNGEYEMIMKAISEARANKQLKK